MSTLDQELPVIRRTSLRTLLTRLRLLPSQRDVQALALMAVLVLLFFLPVLLSGRVLLPVENLWLKEPWRSSTGEWGIQYVHNHLISDMIVQNVSWKTFARDTIRSGQIPLWNPNLLAGVPFLAAGQYGVLYPPGVLFYLLTGVEYAYLPFTALHLWMAGAFMYIFVRILGAQRFGALVSGISFMLCGFLIVSFLWPMIVSTIVYAPLVMAMVELVIRGWETLPNLQRKRMGEWGQSLELNQRDAERAAKVRQGRLWLLYAMIGACAVGLQFLAGHMEISYLLLFSAGFYAALRLILMLWRTRDLLYTTLAGIALLGMVALGAGLAAVQILPFVEAIGANFRSNFVTADEIMSYALPWKHALSTIMPNFYGNPSIHHYYDLFTRSSQVVANPQADGQIIRFVQDWGPKNYVEGTLYVGILPLILAGIALIFRRSYAVTILGIYMVWALLLAFGTPLYRLILLLPGSDQLHTPFRWLIPYTLCVTALAGLGADWLAKYVMRSRKERQADATPGKYMRGIAWSALGSGLLVLLACATVWLVPEQFHGLAAQLSARLARNNPRFGEAFSSPAMFLSYEWSQALLCGGLLAASGLVLVFITHHRHTGNKYSIPFWKPLALTLIAFDLLLFGMGFNSTGDPAMLHYTPPAIKWLQDKQQSGERFRVIAFGEDILPPNTAMLMGLHDARGYDTIIPRQYMEYWRGMEEPSGLLYSMIDRLHNPDSLTSPLLDVLNVRYILAKQFINLPGISEVERWGELHLYQNDNVMPQAWVSGAVEILPHDGVLERLKSTNWDPRQTTLLEYNAPTLDNPDPSLFDKVQPKIVRYTPNVVEIDVTLPAPAYLVLADSYFPYWQALVRSQEAGGTLGEEREYSIYRANGNFRAVWLPAGSHHVRFNYNPLFFKLGLFTSFAAAIAVLGGFSVIIWQPLARRREQEVSSGVRQVTKNSIAPMLTSLVNKAIDLGFAIVAVRLLGPEGNGSYTLAVVTFGYFDIVVNFGLSTLLMREVAKDRSLGNRYLSNTIILRQILTLITAPLMLGLAWLGVQYLGFSPGAMLALGLLFAGLIPGNVAAAFSALFSAYERMEYPAAISVFTTLLKVTIGAAVLITGGGFIGLAAASIVTNTITALIFAFFGLLVLFKPRFEVDLRLMWNMVTTSYPLMLNNMLSGLFFRIDGVMLPALRADGTLQLGWYGAAYKFIDGLNIIPSTLTLAVFPLMARYADAQQEGLTRTFRMALKMLLLCALPISVGTTLLSGQIIMLFGWQEFMPHSAIALAILIWFVPFSYINNVTHYVLIAHNQQRWITWCFIVAVPFNIIANIILIPPLGYIGAAFTTIFSEIVLLIPFWIGIQRSKAAVPLWSLVWRPLFAAIVMGVAVYFLREIHLLVAVVGAAVIYFAMLLLLRGFDEEDKLLLRHLLKKEG